MEKRLPLQIEENELKPIPGFFPVIYSEKDAPASISQYIP
jgi:hypothetical protein